MVERRQVIRQIASSYDGPFIAVAEFEAFVQIWDLRSYNRVSAFETTLDFGGRRLAISRDGAHCAVGAYHVHGVALYDARNGAELWRRKDLKKVQRLRISLADNAIFCGFSDKSARFLDLVTGGSELLVQGTDDVLESPYDDVRVIDGSGRDYVLADANYKQRAQLRRRSFAALDFAFGPGRLCISESAGTVRCFDISSSIQLWEYRPGIGMHALHLAYNEFSETFAAIIWPYEKGGDHRVVNLDSISGQVVNDIVIQGSVEFGFCLKGSVLLSSDGSVRDSATGDVRAVLDYFPISES